MFDDATNQVEFSERLANLARKIEEMVRPMENVFVGIGTPLGEAFEVFNGLDAHFKDLSARMTSESARQAEAAIIASTGQCGAMVAGLAESSTAVSGLESGVTAALPLLFTLQKIIDEVGSLAMNAKIQAAQVTEAGTDFAVFTAEMGRLHNLAHSTVSDAAERITDISRNVAIARSAEEEFRRREGGKLESVRRRLETGTNAFGHRRERAHVGMHGIGETFSHVSQQVAQIIKRMQINDITRQRLEHVGAALDLARLLLGRREGQAPQAHTWLNDLPPARRAGLLIAVCRLQSEQLLQATEAFGAEIDLLKGDMIGLCAVAGKTAEDAVRSLGGGGHDESFLSDLQAEVDESVEALNAYAESYRQVLTIVETIDREFTSLNGNMDEIYSIDADMRIMGLNATLKCGRLGDKGRALGVVAHELRVCSRRTEESSQSVTKLIASARESSSRLNKLVADGFANVSTIQGALTLSMRCFSDLDKALKNLIEDAKRQCGAIAGKLTGTAETIALHEEMRSAAQGICQGLEAIAAAAAGLRPGGESPEEQAAIQDDLRRLLEGHYTMDSERIVHGIATEAESPQAAGELDDIFF